ncbi:carbamate kinase [Ferrimicrobium sp.]|uniref:carbamate kinase n=1 Tax=Ferrimicrobium sp. TaxID=2926050 RepID=UPI00260C9F63|nr:carbamate kinase [Ferrimicrobium sp.]
MRLVVALGGNALLRRGERPDATIQSYHVEEAAISLGRLRSGNQLVVTHGNGPQVGLLALESQEDASLSSPYPLDVLGAQTQGMIGYWISNDLDSAPVNSSACTLITRVVVDPHDAAFGNPTKFVGKTYDAREAADLASQFGWIVKQDGGAWRRVVASPQPLRIVELPVIEGLLAMGLTVICAGGGGVPVMEVPQGGYVGVEAVIDKDLTSAKLAISLDADALMILTDVDAIYRDFGADRASAYRTLSLAQLGEMDFAAGSMGPKVRAAEEFVRHTGRRAVIGSLSDADALLSGEKGTMIVPDEEGSLGAPH